MEYQATRSRNFSANRYTVQKTMICHHGVPKITLSVGVCDLEAAGIS